MLVHEGAPLGQVAAVDCSEVALDTQTPGSRKVCQVHLSDATGYISIQLDGPARQKHKKRCNPARSCNTGMSRITCSICFCRAGPSSWMLT